MLFQQYRLVTRSDFDGLVCGMLLREADMIDDIKFVSPKDMQDASITISGDDIITNLPYVPGCHLAFDHHSSEMTRKGAYVRANHVIDGDAPSAARVVYNYYGGRTTFPNMSDALLDAVDRADTAQFTREEILDPKGWVLMNFIMDPRTGLGRHREFRISNYDLMMQLIDKCREHTIEDVLALPDVAERVALYNRHREPFIEQLQRCATRYGNLVVVDLREEDVIYVGNRFMIYALFPECNLSMHVLWGLKQQNTVFAIGKSIFDRSSTIDVGAICLAHGGGGHEAAGTCQVGNHLAQAVRAELIDVLGMR